MLRASAPRISSLDAEVLLCHALGKDRAWMRAHADADVPSDTHAQYENLVERRSAGEPLQYITQTQEFFGLALHVKPGVLIPRPETEHLVEAVLTWVAEAKLEHARVTDVGTGSGAIAIALAMNLREPEVTAVDISQEALSIARSNADKLIAAPRIHFVLGDLLKGQEDDSLDVVVSNPPYIPDGDAQTMQREVVEHEPHRALFGGEDGLAVYRRLIPQASTALRPGGLLAMEIGYGQRASIADLLRGWDRVRFVNDYAGIPRVVLAERPRRGEIVHAGNR